MNLFAEDPDAPADKAPKKPARMPIFVSSFVMPGLGQFMQKRWISGLVWTTAFLWPMLMTCYWALKIGKLYFALALDEAEDSALEAVPVIAGKLLTWAGIMLVVYLAQVVDAFIGYRLQMMKWLSARRQAMLPPPLP